MTTLACPVCPVTAPFVGELAAHLRASHDYEHQASISAAKAVQAVRDPFGLDANGLKKHVDPESTPPPRAA